MYFVDRKVLEQRLTYFEKKVEFLDTANCHSLEASYALERAAHMLIESMIDVGNQMIDGFIMRDPGSFEDVVDILLDERVISTEENESCKKIIKWRKELLQNYLTIDHQSFLDLWKLEKKHVKMYPTRIRTYLKDELGPVSAFIPN